MHLRLFAIIAERYAEIERGSAVQALMVLTAASEVVGSVVEHDRRIRVRITARPGPHITQKTPLQPM